MKTHMLLVCLVFTIAVHAGCGSQVRSSAYTAADMEMSVIEVRDQLASSRFLSARDADSTPMVLMPTRMANYSNERFSRVDQWAAISRVFLEPDVLELLRSKNISVVLPMDGQRVTHSYSVREGESGAGLDYMSAEVSAAPSHFINARFSSITRASEEDSGDGLADVRKDLFLMEYTIVDARSRETVWAGSTEFARVAHGLLAN